VLEKRLWESRSAPTLGQFWTKKKLVESRRWKKLGYPIFICPRGKEKYGKCGFPDTIFFLWTFCTHRVPYGAKHSLCMLGEERSGARASPSMISECLAPHGTSLAELTIGHGKNIFLLTQPLL
jgi:hypothetical protein